MRKLLLVGTVGAAVALGAAGAYAIPANSPYATWEPQAVDVGIMPMTGQMNEGRAAFVQGRNADVPLATGIPTPESGTYYSRGK